MKTGPQFRKWMVASFALVATPLLVIAQYGPKKMLFTSHTTESLTLAYWGRERMGRIPT